MCHQSVSRFSLKHRFIASPSLAKRRSKVWRFYRHRLWSGRLSVLFFKHHRIASGLWSYQAAHKAFVPIGSLGVISRFLVCRRRQVCFINQAPRCHNKRQVGRLYLNLGVGHNMALKSDTSAVTLFAKTRKKVCLLAVPFSFVLLPVRGIALV